MLSFDSGRLVALAAATVAAAGVVTGCGSSGSGGPGKQNLSVFQEPSGSFTDAAKRSGGR